MTPQFSPGDRVIALSTIEPWITKDKEYTVDDASPDDLVAIIDDRGKAALVCDYRFRPATGQPDFPHPLELRTAIANVEAATAHLKSLLPK